MLPLATTTYTVRRPDASDDFWDGSPGGATTDVATGVRGHRYQPAGAEYLGGGRRVEVDWQVALDVADVTPADLLVDETDGSIYQVAWATRRRGLGLDHVVAGVLLTSGVGVES